MNIKGIFLRLWRLIIQPGAEWKEISSASPREDVARTFVYPLTAVCGVAYLLGQVVRGEWGGGHFFSSVMSAVVHCVALLLTYFLVAWCVNQLRVRYLHQEEDMPLSFLLTGYSMALIFALTIFVGLFPEMVLFKWILQFYVVYIVWNGAHTIMEVEEDKQMTFTLVTSALLLAVPAVINLVFDKWVL